MAKTILEYGTHFFPRPLDELDFGNGLKMHVYEYSLICDIPYTEIFREVQELMELGMIQVSRNGKALNIATYPNVRLMGERAYLFGDLSEIEMEILKKQKELEILANIYEAQRGGS